jgi:hypothetical protein
MPPLVNRLLLFLTLLIPVQMASQTWDDHDRSHRYTCRDFGRNYLMTLPSKGNPIIFCNGDNDTFPLWYNQDTERVRRDVRICNLSYAQTDWYIYQQQCPLYDAPGLPIPWTTHQYQEGTNEYVPVRPELKKQVEAFYQQHPTEAAKNFGTDPFDVNNILKHWVFGGKEELLVIPTDTLTLHLDKQAILRSGILLPSSLRRLKGEALLAAMPDKMVISLKGLTMLTKSELLVLQVLAGCNWERPLYMGISVGREACRINFDNYFLLEGLAYRFTPFDYQRYGDVDSEVGYAVDTEKLYDNLMHRYRYGGLERPGLYLDQTTMNVARSHRRLFITLAKMLLNQGDEKRAAEVMRYAAKVIPSYNVP